MFNKSSLKHRTRIYLKSAEELPIDGKSPYLEIATNEAECHGPERWVCLHQGEKGP